MTRPPLAALFVACVAVAVTAAGMAYAFSLRPPATSTTQVTTTTPKDDLRCGKAPCTPLTSREVGTDTVELLAGGDVGRIRISGPAGRDIFESISAQQGAKLSTDSLQCVVGEVALCLVRGTAPGAVVGEVLLRRAGAWTRAEVPYLASGDYLGLHDVNGDGVADVVAVQSACGQAPCPRRFTQVFSVVGESDLGCSAVVDQPQDLPGWPTVTPDPASLRSECAY
ncbi:hypothetical protein [Saccharothrix violaceirubra]|uniref:hypothetical protein n=1 Tax=Saccharothrix violaceirubra TaxID=413306 RepID=UPI0031ED88DB